MLNLLYIILLVVCIPINISVVNFIYSCSFFGIDNKIQLAKPRQKVNSEQNTRFVKVQGEGMGSSGQPYKNSTSLGISRVRGSSPEAQRGRPMTGYTFAFAKEWTPPVPS